MSFHQIIDIITVTEQQEIIQIIYTSSGSSQLSDLQGERPVREDFLGVQNLRNAVKF